MSATSGLTAAVTGKQAPAVLPAGSTSPPSSALTPQQIRTAYGVGSISPDGNHRQRRGQTIAIIDVYDDPDFVDTGSANFATSDLAVFDRQFGLPDPPSFTKVDENGGTNLPAAGGGWTVEEALDVEWAHAMAGPSADLLVEAVAPTTNDMFTAIDTARHMSGVSAVFDELELHRRVCRRECPGQFLHHARRP